MFTSIGIVATLLTLIVNGVFQSLREKRRDELVIENRKMDIADRVANRDAGIKASEILTDKIVGKIDERASGTDGKIDANTDISAKAFDVANNVNEKIATVAALTNAHAVTSMNDVMNELAAIKRLLQGGK